MYIVSAQLRLREQSVTTIRSLRCAQLTDEERVYLNAAALGDVGCIRLTLEEADEEAEKHKEEGAESAPPSASINLNCTDYMGRCARALTRTSARPLPLDASSC